MKATLPSVAAPDRCPWAIKAGTTLTTRCSKTAGHDGKHEGKGLAEFTYQRWDWLPGDRREFETDRVDEYAWDAEKRPIPRPSASASRPPCGAPGWATWVIADLAMTDNSGMKTPHTCANCGRSARFDIQRSEDEIRSELVQTGGPNPPDWYPKPWPRLHARRRREPAEWVTGRRTSGSG